MRFAAVFLLVMATVLSVVPTPPKQVMDAEIRFVFLPKEVDGSISGFQSHSDIDLEQPERSKFNGSVAVETLKTGIFLRDWHLKGGKYFDKKKYPRITFESEKVFRDDEQLIVDGQLTLKGTTKPLRFLFRTKGNQLIGTATMYTSDFGIHIKKKREENKVEISIVLKVDPD